MSVFSDIIHQNWLWAGEAQLLWIHFDDDSQQQSMNGHGLLCFSVN